MKFIRLLMAITFIVALIFCIGTGGALSNFQITLGRAAAQWGVSLAVMMIVLKAGRVI